MDADPASLVAALILAGTFLLGRWLGRGSEESGHVRRGLVSAAAGVSVAYVFVDVLPELAEQHRVLVEAAEGEALLFAEQRIYLLALISFVVLYGLEYIVLAARERRRGVVEGGGGDAIYRIHLAGYSAYSALIGYLLVERAERGGLALAFYTLAMAVHFLIVDHALGEEHGERFERVGRFALVVSVLLGWLLGATTEISEVVFARLFAVLAGGVVITSLRAELPGERRGRFWPFTVAAVAFALLLGLA